MIDRFWVGSNDCRICFVGPTNSVVNVSLQSKTVPPPPPLGKQFFTLHNLQQFKNFQAKAPFTLYSIPHCKFTCSLTHKNPVFFLRKPSDGRNLHFRNKSGKEGIFNHFFFVTYVTSNNIFCFTSCFNNP